jgi:hypothetical protein
MAYDAAHPLPAWVRSDLPNIEVSLPERDSCAPLRDTPMPDAPLVELRSDEARLDTIVLGPLATSAKDFAKALLGKRERRTATFGRVRRFMGPIVFAVERNLPMSVVVPYLEAARSASYPEVDVWVTKPARRFASRTHGTFVEPRPICRLTHRLDRPLPTSDTWNDWTERLETPSVQAKSN